MIAWLDLEAGLVGNGNINYLYFIIEEADYFRASGETSAHSQLIKNFTISKRLSPFASKPCTSLDFEAKSKIDEFFYWEMVDHFCL